MPSEPPFGEVYGVCPSSEATPAQQSPLPPPLPCQNCGQPAVSGQNLCQRCLELHAWASTIQTDAANAGLRAPTKAGGRAPRPAQQTKKPKPTGKKPKPTGTDGQVLSIIKAQPKGKGIKGQTIVNKLKRQGIAIALSTLKRHVIAKLKA